MKFSQDNRRHRGSMLDDLYTNMEKMMFDLSKIRAAAERSNAGVDSILAVVHEQSAQLKEVSAKLAAANTANDPVAQAAVQAELDKIADGLNSEADHIAADIMAPAKPAPEVPVAATVG